MQISVLTKIARQEHTHTHTEVKVSLNTKSRGGETSGNLAFLCCLILSSPCLLLPLSPCSLQRQQSEQLESSLLKAQNALQSCDLQLAQLRAELEVTLGHLIEWQRLRDELQVHVSTTQDVMQINLLAFNQSELCVELRPHPSSDLLSNELEPLRLSVTWSHDNRFRLQVSEGTAGLAEDSLMGRRVELSAALLEVMRCYVGQAELLSEIQSLRSSFAIDWRPAQHLLVYLKTASLVCHLEVEEGYPRAGRARLLSVRRDGQHVDTSGLKPPSGELRLTEWLVFLHSSPLL
uniref:Uncharacterized LOC100710036 n=1 Tax=Oreochromis niloticus TaxID=8128 RepID=A0A669EIJ5_ORENI